MVLYVDETECSEYFIVTGLLVNSKQDVDMAYKRFKKYAHSIAISPNKKSVLFGEFKSTLMDIHYQKAKIVMLNELNRFEHCIIYSTFVKKEKTFSQKEKERAYINMIARIVASFNEKTDVIFDKFNKKDFESNIVKKLLSFEHISSGTPRDSLDEAGLKFADNLCSVMRLHKTNLDKSNFYALVADYVKEV